MEQQNNKRVKFFEASESTLVRLDRKVYMQLADIAEKQKMNPRLLIEMILLEYCNCKKKIL